MIFLDFKKDHRKIEPPSNNGHNICVFAPRMITFARHQQLQRVLEVAHFLLQDAVRE